MQRKTETSIRYAAAKKSNAQRHFSFENITAKHSTRINTYIFTQNSTFIKFS